MCVCVWRTQRGLDALSSSAGTHLLEGEKMKCFEQGYRDGFDMNGICDKGQEMFHYLCFVNSYGHLMHDDVGFETWMILEMVLPSSLR